MLANLVAQSAPNRDQFPNRIYRLHEAGYQDAMRGEPPADSSAAYLEGYFERLAQEPNQRRAPSHDMGHTRAK